MVIFRDERVCFANDRQQLMLQRVLVTPAFDQIRT